MGGTKNGGKKTAQKLLAQDPDYYKKLRAKVKKPVGGKVSAGSFVKGSDRARKLGALGGRKSKRTEAKTKSADGAEQI